MRVAHILGDLQYGGLQRRVLTLIRELPSDWSHALVFNRDGPLHDEYAAHCRMVHCSYKSRSPVAALLYLPRLSAELRAFAPDVVLAHLFGNHLVVAIAARLAGVPATFSVSANNPVHYARSRWQPRMLAQLARPVCTGEIAVSEAVGSVLRDQLGLPSRRVHVIPNGCDVETISRRAEAGRRVRQPDGTRRLLMIALISRAKDHETPIRALALLKERGFNVHLSFAGDVRRTERRDALERTAQSLGVADAVEFLGARNDVLELIGASDVVIHATHSEGLPGAVLEAMAGRTPVVATDIPPCREVLDGGRCGLLVPLGSAEAMAKAVEQLLSDEMRTRDLVDAAYRRVSEVYHARRMAQGYQNLITSTLAGKD
jgi:glycosyltransferase involved in cell wall biosynthesis